MIIKLFKVISVEAGKTEPPMTISKRIINRSIIQYPTPYISPRREIHQAVLYALLTFLTLIKSILSFKFYFI